MAHPLLTHPAMADFKYAVRQLTRSPWFTAVAVLTLTLGMGANTAFFSVLYGVVLRQPAYPAAGRLVSVYNVSGAEVGNGGRLSRAEYRDFRERQRAMEGLAAADLGRMTLTSSGADGTAIAERVKVSGVTPNVFPILGIAPALGRSLRDGDEATGSVAVISDGLWRAKFNATADILQRTVRMNGTEFAIVGVMPAGFGYPEPDMGAWVPLDLRSRGDSDRGDHYLGVIGRLAQETTAAAARLDLQRVARELRAEQPAAYPDERWSIGVASLRHSQFGHLTMPLGLLMAAAAFVLLIACVNVAVMSLLRALARRRDISISLALGATRRDVIRQLVAEAMVLSAVGAAGGMLVAAVGLSWLKAVAPADIPRLGEVAINIPTALFTCVVLVIVTLLVGLAPAAVALRVKGLEGRLHTGRAADGRSTTRLRDALTVMEIALAAALLICAGLTLRSLHALTRVDLGFATDQRFSFKTNLTTGDYPDAARVDRFYEQLISRVESLPGTTSIGAISYLPLSGEGQAVAAAPVGAAAGVPTELTVGWGIVRGRYFETMDIPLVQGRLFSREDRQGSPAVTIVDDVLARRVWASEAAAIGRQIRFGSGKAAETRTVIGVVHRVTHLGPGRESLPMAFAPQSQVYQRGMYTVVKTTAPAEVLMPAVRTALTTVDRSVPMYFAETVGARYAAALALPRFTASLVSAFSTLALVLAGVGIFGVTAYAVAQRTREFGIRFALGAQQAHVVRLVLGRVGMLAAIGVGLGAALGLGAGSLMAGVLFGVSPDDPPTMAAAVCLIFATSVLASIVPLRHAIGVDPAETLRAE